MSMRKRLFGLFVASVAMLAGLVLMPSAATAASAPLVGVNVSSSDDSTVAAQCYITRGAHQGGRICDWSYVDVVWNDGRKETFIIGWDYAMWHIWQRYNGDPTWSGWQTMNGGFTAGVSVPSMNPPTVKARGLDYNYYCKRHTSSGWTPNWYRC
jgi:hypothetical protein